MPADREVEPVREEGHEVADARVGSHGEADLFPWLGQFLAVGFGALDKVVVGDLGDQHGLFDTAPPAPQCLPLVPTSTGVCNTDVGSGSGAFGSAAELLPEGSSLSFLLVLFSCAWWRSWSSWR